MTTTTHNVHSAAPLDRYENNRRQTIPGRRHPPGQRARRLQAEPLEKRCLLTAGQLDPSFGTDGMLYPDLGEAGANYADIRSMVIDSNDRLVIVGEIAHYGGLFLARLHEDGSWDTSFGEEGLQAITPQHSGGSLAVDDLQRIVVSTNQIDPTLTKVVRYHEDGSPDTSFGTQGVVSIENLFGGVRAIDSSGRILVTGLEGDAPHDEYRAAVARLTPDGVLDASFADDGVQTFDLGFARESARDLAVDAQGRVIVVGSSYLGAGAWAARLTPDGELDTSFADDGKQILDLPRSGAVDVVLDDAGRIVILAYTRPDVLSDSSSVVIRLTPDGSLDTTFGADGIQVVDSSNFSSDLAIDGSGRIVVAVNRDLPRKSLVARLLPDGQVDHTFGDDGEQIIDFGTGSFVMELEIDSSGRVVVAGDYRKDDIAWRHWALARLLGDSVAIPGDFNGNGLVEQADLDLVLLHWGEDETTPPEGWTGPAPSGIVDQAELDAVLLNWGSGTTAGAVTVQEEMPPAEPASLHVRKSVPARLDKSQLTRRSNEVADSPLHKVLSMRIKDAVFAALTRDIQR